MSNDGDGTMRTNMTPEQVIQKLAQIASDVGWQAGVGAMETAGCFVSVLAAHPEKISAFLAGELSVIDDFALLQAEMGCLTWHARGDGQVIHPGDARAARQKHDH
jgi:hypothetical protein